MLGAVVLEHPAQVRQPADRDDVADEDRGPQHPLDEPEEQRRAELILDQAGGGDRDDEEEADRQRHREGDRQRPGEAADRLRLLPVLLHELGVGRDRERPEADLQRLAERDDAADHRQPQEPVALRPRDERLGGDLDLAVGACAPRPPRSRRRASSRPRAPPGRRRARRARRPACRPASGSRRARGAARRSPPPAPVSRACCGPARRLKRSTRPPVSTSFCLPV